MFSGEIPSLFCCNQVLDLSHNNLSGMMLQCFGNLSSMLVLNLEGNNFHALLSQLNSTKAIKMGQTNLQVRLPRSLGYCKMLEFLDLVNNKIKDTFPSWLGALLELRILILHSNRWNAITDLDGENATYLHAYNHHFMVNLIIIPYQFPYSMTITNKGEKMEYEKILEVCSAMDLSCNKFEGEILEVVGNLKGFQLLNLSNNILVGPIPIAFGFLANLEALDLSQNKFTGRIPTQLT
ncbi:hypothetical protein SLA2020_356760 [Shorea laevis]